jgi:hypothetical protein
MGVRFINQLTRFVVAAGALVFLCRCGVKGDPVPYIQVHPPEDSIQTDSSVIKDSPPTEAKQETVPTMNKKRPSVKANKKGRQ